MVKLNKIYTKTGDDGTTGLVDGSRVAKNDPRMAAIGDVDELNGAIGVMRVAMADLLEEKSDPLLSSVDAIQNDLFDLGADLATPADDGDFTPSEMVLRMVPSQVERLEQEIDAITGSIDPLTSFILPGGNAAAAAAHLARTVARRAERTMVSAAQVVELNPVALQYINRLSDLIFVMARMLNDGGKADVKWVPGGSRQA